MSMPKRVCIALLVSLTLTAPGQAQPAAPEGPLIRSSAPLEGCPGNVAFDDGTVESGYGWVPSVTSGIYVQELPASMAPHGALTEVCICWLRTRADDSIDFSVVIYADVDGAPSEEPVHVVPASATGVPLGIVGRFYPVAVGLVHVPSDPFYVGVSWDASADGFFFVCNDRTPATPIVDGFFRDELSGGWTSVLESNDPIFTPHRAMMVRARGASIVDVPGPGWAGLSVLALALATAGVLAVRRV